MIRTAADFRTALLLLLATTAGCSGAHYRRWADSQVNRILADRARTTLDYRPQTQIAATPDTPVPARAYEKVPVTPVVPKDLPPPLATPEPVEVEYGPLGPEARWIGLPVPEETQEQNGTSVRLGGGDVGAATVGENPFAYGPPLPRQPAHRFDLFQSLQYAVQHSRQYQGELEGLYLAALDVTLERHLLSPRPFLRTGAEYAGGQQTVDYRSALAVTTRGGVRQRLPYGGEVVAEALVRFVDTLDRHAANAEEASLVLSGSLPLLRGAGMVNLEGLISSERGLVYTVREFEEFRRSFAVNIARSYFGLLARQQSVRNRRLNYDNLSVLTERTRALFGAGRISFLEVQRSEQALLQAEQGVIAAREQYQNTLDDFKILLGMPVEEELAVIPVALDLNMPDLEGQDVFEDAFRHRLDMQTARDRIDDARRQIGIARNGLLPDLSLTAQGQAGNRQDDPARKLDSRTLTYSAGVTLDIPIDQLPERNAYRQALIQFERARRAYEQLREEVVTDVLADVRSIRSSEASLQIAQQSIELAERRLDLASELLRQPGTGTARRADARDVVDAQQDLLEAQDDYEQNRAELQVQVLQFLQNTGTLRVDPEAGLLGRALRGESRGAAGASDKVPAQ